MQEQLIYSDCERVGAELKAYQLDEVWQRTEERLGKKCPATISSLAIQEIHHDFDTQDPREAEQHEQHKQTNKQESKREKQNHFIDVHELIKIQSKQAPTLHGTNCL